MKWRCTYCEVETRENQKGNRTAEKPHMRNYLKDALLAHPPFFNSLAGQWTGKGHKLMKAVSQA
jgi:hypothetical protein